MSEWQKQHGFNEGPFETLKIGLYRDRAELYALIDERCDQNDRKRIARRSEGSLCERL